MAAKIQKSAAYGCPSNFSPQQHLGFAAQNQRKIGRKTPEISGKSIFGTPGRDRTYGQELRSLLLYPLSYRGVSEIYRIRFMTDILTLPFAFT